MLVKTDGPDREGDDQVYTLVLSRKEAMAIHGACEEKEERLSKIHGKHLGDWGMEKLAILRQAVRMLPGEEP